MAWKKTGEATEATKGAIKARKIAEREKDNADEARGDAEKQRNEAIEQARLARRGAYNVQLALAEDLWRHQPAQVIKLLNDTNLCPLDLRDFSWWFLNRLAKTVHPPRPHRCRYLRGLRSRRPDPGLH